MLVHMKFYINHINTFLGIDLIPQVKIEDLKQMKVCMDTSFSRRVPNYITRILSSSSQYDNRKIDPTSLFVGLYKTFKETAERVECLKEETCKGMIIKSSLRHTCY